jgi:hypothetical protein
MDIILEDLLETSPSFIPACWLFHLMCLCLPEPTEIFVTPCFLLACSVQPQPPIGPFCV